MRSVAKHSCAALGAALATALLAGAPATAQDKPQDKPVELKLAHWLPPTHSIHKAMQAWAASIEQASGGTIKHRIYPAQQLGKAFDHYDMARDGIADVTFINAGYQPGRFPVIGAGELPFLMTNGKGGSQALDAWYRTYAPAEMKDVRFCLGFVHEPGAIHSRTKKVVKPGDIKGMKIRPAHATIAAFVTRLGGTNVQSSAPEAREVLERGVADALTFPWSSLGVFGIDKVVKYHMDVPLYATTFAWVMNKDKYAQLSPAQRKVIDAHCTNEWALKVAAPWSDYEVAGHAKLKADPNREVYGISAGQLAEWKAAAEPLEGVWADGVRKAGGNPEQILRELRASLSQHQAAY